MYQYLNFTLCIMYFLSPRKVKVEIPYLITKLQLRISKN